MKNHLVRKWSSSDDDLELRTQSQFITDRGWLQFSIDHDHCRLLVLDDSARQDIDIDTHNGFITGQLIDVQEKFPERSFNELSPMFIVPIGNIRFFGTGTPSWRDHQIIAVMISCHPPSPQLVMKMSGLSV